MLNDFIYEYLPKFPYYANLLLLLGGMFLTLALAYLVSRWTEFLVGGATISIFAVAVVLMCR